MNVYKAWLPALRWTMLSIVPEGPQTRGARLFTSRTNCPCYGPRVFRVCDTDFLSHHCTVAAITLGDTTRHLQLALVRCPEVLHYIGHGDLFTHEGAHNDIGETQGLVIECILYILFASVLPVHRIWSVDWRCFVGVRCKRDPNQASLV